MLDREKVIKGIHQHCEGSLFDRCGECPYYEMDFGLWGEDKFMCRDELLSDVFALLKKQEEIVRCKDCKHGRLYCTEDVCGETLIECNRPDLGDAIEIHRWNWYCADGERR